MASNYSNTSLPQDIIVDSGLLYLGNTPFGVSVGGLKFDQAKKLENVEFDGKRSPIAGLDRVVDYAPKITGKFLPFGTGSVTVFDPGGSSSFGSLPTTGSLTPVSGSSFFGAGSYISNLRLIYQRGAGGFAQVRFPLALCTDYKLAGTDKKAAEVDATFEARLNLASGSGNTTDTAPYIVELLATIP